MPVMDISMLLSYTAPHEQITEQNMSTVTSEQHQQLASTQPQDTVGVSTWIKHGAQDVNDKGTGFQIPKFMLQKLSL